MEPVHQPAMVSEVLAHLEPHAGMTILDMTVGMGGHARRLLERGAFVIGLDRDRESLERARGLLAGFEERCLLLWGRMSAAAEVLADHGIHALDGCLIDAGISMDQMLDAVRGFSAHSNEMLDMRMDRSQPGPTAFDIVNSHLDNELARVFSIVGNWREARRVTAAIVAARKREPITTTAQLAQLIAATIAGRHRPREIDAAPYLLALRVAVNDELNELCAGIESAAELLSPNGTLVALTWHSSEHRATRQTLRRLANPCTCPPAVPCNCGKTPVLRVLTPKPLFAAPEEVQANPATRSVRLHAAAKVLREADRAA